MGVPSFVQAALQVVRRDRVVFLHTGDLPQIEERSEDSADRLGAVDSLGFFDRELPLGQPPEVQPQKLLGVVIPKPDLPLATRPDLLDLLRAELHGVNPQPTLRVEVVLVEDLVPGNDDPVAVVVSLCCNAVSVGEIDLEPTVAGDIDITLCVVSQAGRGRAPNNELTDAPGASGKKNRYLGRRHLSATLN